VVVLVGPSRTVAAFERELPERIRSRVVARVPRPRGWASADGARKDAVLAVAAKAHDALRARAGRGPDRLVGEALRGGIAVVGPEDVALALAEGRVHALVLEETFERAGWCCDNCDALGANAESAEACPFCGGELHVVHDLAEALVARTLAVGGTVDVVPRERRLHGYGGVGAFLRQTAPTGLRGASPPWPTAPGATSPPDQA
jgi:peptide subunit release factor 1 (eRF1)